MKSGGEIRHPAEFPMSDGASLFTSLRDGNRPRRMEGANISTEHSPGSAPPLPNVAEHRFHVSREGFNMAQRVRQYESYVWPR